MIKAYRLRMFGRMPLVGGVLLGGARVAHADSQDDRYLAALAGQGIRNPTDQLIAEGRFACDNYGTPGLVGQTLGVEGWGLTYVQPSNLL